MMTLDTLSKRQSEIAEFYARNGYYVLQDGFSPAEIAALRAETVRICAGEIGDIGGAQGRLKGETDDQLLRRFFVHSLPAQNLAADV